MTFTAMQPSYMTAALGYATQQPVSPLQLGQQQALSISESTRQEEQIHPQEHLVSPQTFWARIARIGIRRGAPVARQVLETVLYQQVTQQQIAAPQLSQLGMAMPHLAGQQVSVLNGAIQQEEQVHPQEHLVSPQTFWTKVARMAVRHGVEVARQILDVLQTQHQVEQQIQEQAIQQQLAQQYVATAQYGQTQYGQTQYGQTPYAQALGLRIVPQITPTPLSALSALSTLGAVHQAQYGQQVSPQYVSQQHQQAAHQVPVAAGVGF
ncbi:hypothetical protein [Sphaerimonospora thailandensis]|uniref:Uncharacterized protein n=1 Tax=Sphaerimonospora thailandensis TaxID=795644 RepID=A0A8J3W0J4_9ACTN|nr:hypothetical protein [Sphaerimonospora thailandensis]GIH71687.1 hypothetical protein Mth01_39400 [Sphaerimonospora thailandensis]